MNLTAAETLALTMMKEHGILDKGWTFQFSNAKKELGHAHYGYKRIVLSRHMVEHDNTENHEHVVQTMLHEIAHVLAGKSANHGPVWKIAARNIGYTGGRIADFPTSANETVPTKTFPPFKGEPGDTIKSGSLVGVILRSNKVNYVTKATNGRLYNFRKTNSELIKKADPTDTTQITIINKNGQFVPNDIVRTIPGRTEFHDRIATVVKVNRVNYILRLSNGEEITAPFGAVISY